MRISRKAPKKNMNFKIFSRDFLNESEESTDFVNAKDKQGADTPCQSIEDPAPFATTSNGQDSIGIPQAVETPEFQFKLGFEQCKREWIYLISEKMAPDEGDRFSPCKNKEKKIVQKGG